MSTEPTAATEQAAPWGSPGDVPDRSLVSAVTIDGVRAAAERIEGIASRTPAVSFARLDAIVGASVTLKCENLQPIGAFKIRGGVNAMMRLSDEQRSRGVITYSSGNHAQAIAYAAARLAVPAVIVMPTDAPRVKLESTRGLLAEAPKGSEVIEYDPASTKREDLGRRLATERGLHLIPPYDHPDVIAGQGTAALELIEEAGPFDSLFVCCGGGGLLTGSATVSKALQPGCRVIGVEPSLADDAKRSHESGVLQVVSNPPTIADGTRTPFMGRYTLPIALERVDEIMTVSEREIARATMLCFETLRLVVEPSGALGIAGAIKAAASGESLGDRVGVIISGGNIDLDRLPEIRAIAEGVGIGEGAGPG
jgi:threonine dehydratase